MSTKSTTPGPQAPPAVENVRGKVVVITGASSGLGLETAKQLASRGAEIVSTAAVLARVKPGSVSVSGRRRQLA